MFYVVSLGRVPKELEDELTFLAFENGATGVSENLSFNKKVYPEPEIIETDFKNLVCYFDVKPDEFARQIQNQYPQIDISITQEENKDWLAEWKKGFKSFQLVDKYWIVPSWEKIENQNIDPIWIDPGMAFGTGTHETTQLCSELIFEVLSANKINSLIDVGTGTGILAFLAKKMGVSKVLGTDNDLEAIRVAHENAELNKLQIELTEKDLPLIDESYDVVVANIIDGVLLQMKHNLMAKTKKFLIVSGIIEENDSDFISEFQKNINLKMIKRVQKGEWVSYLFEKT